ncbi:hypothetical protein NQ314_001269 [Rhamnusium bicolor]|uniref:PPIase cyclophilin-type domain-containing protein n=1 Tax=Rhamnusium bicolor TaxID=1586634 RepID=A0AAV8ZUP9_9CUCU|nr:hypothetical protein NQ314_001269 [Rhamnusium bicolor]
MVCQHTLVELLSNCLKIKYLNRQKTFGALCTGEKGIGKFGKPLHYKGSTFHRGILEYTEEWFSTIINNELVNSSDGYRVI